MNQSAAPRSDTLRAAVEITEKLCRLPAVATLDWLDRAAGALRGVIRPSRACVLILHADPSGSGVQLEAAGFAGNPGGQRQPGEEDEASVELSVRSRAERLDQLGFQTPDQPVLSTLADLLAGGDWRARGIGKLWQGIPGSEVLVAGEPLGGVERGRVMISMVALGEPGGESKPAHLELLGAIHPMLVRRALLAIGSTRATSSRWLTGREQEVLDLLVIGKSVRVIAEELGRSPHTVHDHVKSLHRKLGASSRGELVARALGHTPIVDSGDRVPEVRTTQAAQRLARPEPAKREGEEAPDSLPIEAYRSRLGD